MRPDRSYIAELASRGYLHRPCGRCGHAGPQTVGAGAGPHPYRIRCARCDANLGFPPKPGNFDKRRHQSDHRTAWRDLLGGRLACAWCGIVEGPGTTFHIDHLYGKVDRGQLVDEFWNTMPLCNICHTFKNSTQAMRRRPAA